MGLLSKASVAFVIALLFTPMLAGSAAAQPNDGGMLEVGVGQDPVGFDPHLTSAYSSFQVLENVYDTLVTFDENLQPHPELATRWETSEDGLIWTFYLREGVEFHNGQAFTSEDVKYSFERILDPDTGSGHAYNLAVVKRIETPDPYTVKIYLDNPYAPMLTKVGSYKGLSIVPRQEAEAGTLDTHPVGTGPFQFVEYVPGDKVILERFDEYWGASEGLPYLDGITYQIIPDETVKLTALRTGQVDWIDSLPAQSVTQLMNDRELVVERVPGTSYWYMALNLEREPFNDVRVRRAISFVIDREVAAAAALWDNAVPAQNPVAPDSYWYSGYEPYEVDIDRARELLAEAGYADGFEMELMPSSSYPEGVRAAQVIQQALRQIGIEASIYAPEWSTWLDLQGTGQFDAFIGSWVGLIDPDDYFYAQHRSGEGFNFTGYSSPAFDELVLEGRQTVDSAARKDAYDEAAKIIIDDAPYVYLFIPASVNAWRPWVQGYDVLPTEAVDFTDTWLESH